MGKLIKVYGERNTNTNYVSKLIELNLDANEVSGVAPPSIMRLQKILPGKELVRDIYFHLTFASNLGWKHTKVKPQQELDQYPLVNDDLSFLTITKNPYSWLISLHRNPYHQYYSRKPDFETFLQQPWKTIARDNVDHPLQNPMALWNIKNKSYLQLARERCLNITSEDIFVDPEKVINQISQHFSIEKKSDTFINYERSTKDKSKDSNYYREFYLKEKWRENLSSEAIAIINEGIDKELMSHFGYQVLS